MSGRLDALALSFAAAMGIFYLYSALCLGWRGMGIGPRPTVRRWRLGRTLDRLGIVGIPARQLWTAVVAFFLLGAGGTFFVVGAVVPSMLVGLIVAFAPLATYRLRYQRRLEAAREAWPRLLEEVRLLTCSLGKSIPQALFETGQGGPVELRPAFAVAEREWLMTTDFHRTVHTLKEALSDPTADSALETLLVAHEIGGSDLDHRLRALIEDRVADLAGRKDALSQQAGVRFARRFVLVVPVGMALVGLSIGTGRDAYETGVGQIALVAGTICLAACWIWAGRLLRLPQQERVFSQKPAVLTGRRRARL